MICAAVPQELRITKPRRGENGHVAAHKHSDAPAQRNRLDRPRGGRSPDRRPPSNSPRAPSGEQPTVGKFMGMMTGKSMIIGLITEIGEQAMSARTADSRSARSARLDLVGEIPRRRRRRGALSARRHRISQHRRRRAAAGRARAAPGLRRRRCRPCPYRRPAAEIRISACTSTSTIWSAGISPFSAPPASANRAASPSSCRRFSTAAEPAHLPGRSAQRIRPLFRRQGAGAHPAQPAAAVLAVQFRGNDRRLLRRPSRRRRGSRDPFRSHPAGEVRLSAIPRRAGQPADQDAAIRAIPVSPPTRRCPTASRI